MKPGFESQSFEEKESRESIIESIGAAEDKGWKYELKPGGKPGETHDVMTMQDRHVEVKKLGGKKDRHFFAVYDSHGWDDKLAQAALKKTDKLYEYVNQMLEKKFAPEAALTFGFSQVDKDIEAIPGPQHESAGVVAVTALFEGKTLYIANAGDARAILEVGGKPVRLSYDHVPNDSSETKRIEKGGGTVSRDAGDSYRVNEDLAVSRSLGDRNEPLVIPLPYIKKIEIQSDFKRLILASDGLWKIFTDSQVIRIIKDETDSQVAAEAITAAVVKYNTERRTSYADNVTVLVLNLKA